MVSPRDVLNKIKWETTPPTLQGVRVFYLNRGAPADESILESRQILDVGQSFLDLDDGTRLPHHRILRIERDGVVVWKRRGVPTA